MTSDKVIIGILGNKTALQCEQPDGRPVNVSSASQVLQDGSVSLLPILELLAVSTTLPCLPVPQLLATRPVKTTQLE